MAKHGFKVFDSDMHIMEPPDLWERYIDRSFDAHAPRGRTSENVRDLRMIYPTVREWARTTARQTIRRAGKTSKEIRTSTATDAERGWTGGSPARRDGHRRHRRCRALSHSRSTRVGPFPDYGPAFRRGDGARLQRLAL